MRQNSLIARLYSIAIVPECRGHGIAKQLMLELEQRIYQQGRQFMRLEVSEKNLAATTLYTKLGYKVFGSYSDYYENHDTALRMQKQISKAPESLID
jgi:ribosomal protein S18 acetylase RimI-like enzyme